MKPFTIAVIGGNAAGAAAAAKAKRVNPSARVVLFEKTEFISVGVCEFPFVLSGEIQNPASLLFYTPEKFSEEKKVEVFVQTEVVSINTKERLVKFKIGDDAAEIELNYDKLILATGSRQGEFPGLDPELENVLWLKKYPDLLRTKQYLETNRPNHATIIGSGYLGLEIAEAMVSRGMDVTIIEKLSHILPAAEPEFSAIIEGLLKSKNVEIVNGYKNLSFSLDSNRVNAVKVDSLRIETGCVFPVIGFRPDTRLISGLDFKRGASGEIITDAFTRTSVPHVYAAGDSTGVKNFLTGRNQVFYSAKVAHNTGHISGSNAAGRSEQFSGAIPVVSFRLFTRYFAQTGLTEKIAREHGFVTKSAFSLMPNLVHVMPESMDTAAKLIVNRLNNQIIGASFWGGKEVSGLCDLITLIIRNKMTYNSLLETDFNYTPALSPFRNILISLIHKIGKG
ncbi:MAG: putative pyridine nucleotide-disulphide oxidoreductase [Ignavibacteriales bacterium]